MNREQCNKKKLKNAANISFNGHLYREINIKLLWSLCLYFIFARDFICLGVTCLNKLGFNISFSQLMIKIVLTARTSNVDLTLKKHQFVYLYSGDYLPRIK